MPNVSQFHPDTLNALNRMYQQILGHEPRYRFWKNEKGDRYFYTTEKTKYKGSIKFIAGIYRYIKTRKQWKLVRTAGFAKRYKAKERAKEWYDLKK